MSLWPRHLPTKVLVGPENLDQCSMSQEPRGTPRMGVLDLVCSQHQCGNGMFTSTGVCSETHQSAQVNQLPGVSLMCLCTIQSFWRLLMLSLLALILPDIVSLQGSCVHNVFTTLFVTMLGIGLQRNLHLVGTPCRFVTGTDHTWKFNP